MRAFDIQLGQILRWLARERLTARIRDGEVVLKRRPLRRSRLTGEPKQECVECGAVGWHAEDCEND